MCVTSKSSGMSDFSFGYKKTSNTQSLALYCQISEPKSRRTKLAEPRDLLSSSRRQPMMSVIAGAMILGSGSGVDVLSCKRAFCVVATGFGVTSFVLAVGGGVLEQADTKRPASSIVTPRSVRL